MSNEGNDWFRAPRPSPAPSAEPAPTPRPPTTVPAPPPLRAAPAPAPPPYVTTPAPPLRAPSEPEPLDVDAFETDAPPTRRRRRVAIACAVLVVVGIVIARRAGRHALVAQAPAPVVLPPPLAAAPPVAPVPPVEIALDPDGTGRAPAAPPTSDANAGPRPKHRLRAHPRHERRLASRAPRAKKEKPAGDYDAARASYQRGNGQLLTGNAPGAIAAYEEAVRLAPTDPIGYRGLGLAYEKEGKVDKAIAALVSYLRLSRHAHDREVIARRLYRLTHPQDQ